MFDSLYLKPAAMFSPFIKLPQAQEHQSLFEDPIIKEVVQIIKREACINCPICFAEYDSIVKYPVQACSNKHTFCKVCVDALKPASKFTGNAMFSNSGNSSNRNSSSRTTLIPCPTCKTDFFKQQVQRNRIMESITVEIIPKVKNTLKEYTRLKKKQIDELVEKRSNEVRETLQKEIVELKDRVAKRQLQFQAFRLEKEQEMANLIAQTNIYRGLPELNTINALTIRLLAQQNQRLKLQLVNLQTEVFKNYTLFKPKSQQPLAINQNKNATELTQKHIKQQIAEKKIFKGITNKFHKYIHYISTVNIDTLHTLELKSIKMTNSEFLILLRIQFRSLKKLVLSHNFISLQKAEYYLQNIKEVQKLDLSFNTIKYLPTNFQHFQSLQILNLQSNQLQQLEQIVKLKRLRSLNVKQNGIIWKGSSKLQFTSRQIQAIYVDFCLSQLVNNLKHIKTLQISNKMSNLSQSVQNELEKVNQILKGRHLQELVLEYCFSELDYSPNINLGTLNSLTLRNNRIRQFNFKSAEFTYLKKLVIKEPGLLQFPEELLQGGQIQQLQLQCEEVPFLPLSLECNRFIRSMSIKIKELTEFPQCVYQFKELEVLNLQNLYLFDLVSQSRDYFISERIAQLANLREIALHSLVRMQVDISTLLQALNDFANKAVRRIELQKFIITNSSFEQIASLTQLQALTLINGQLQILPECIGQLKALICLNISKNNINALPGSLFSLKHLQLLDLRENPIKNIPHRILQLQNLIQLQMNLEPAQITNQQDIVLAYDLFEREIEVVSYQRFDIGSFTELAQPSANYVQLVEEQDLSEKEEDSTAYQSYRFQATRYLSAFQKFTQLPFYFLAQLCLSSIQLTTQQLNLKERSFPFVKRLDLSRNLLKLRSEDEFFVFLPKLESLDMSHNPTYQIPADIKLLSIVKLNLSHNKLQLIQTELYTSTTLTHLDLSYNHLSKLQQPMVELQSTALVQLNLEGNQLSQTPHFVLCSQQLTKLNVSYNKQQFKLCKGIHKLGNLTSIKANGMVFDSFPIQFTSNITLHELQINTYGYHPQPGQLAFMPFLKLTSLSLEGYHFRTIPPTLYNLKCLEKLNLSNNQIESISQNVAQLSTLNTLELRFNLLSSGLMNLAKMRMLCLLDINFNDIASATLREVVNELSMSGVIVLSCLNSGSTREAANEQSL